LGTTTEGEGNADDLTVATSGHTGMTIRSGTANRGNIYFSDGTSGDAEYRGYIEYNHDGDKLSFGTANGTRLHINSAGRVGIGTVSPSESLEVAGNGFKVSGQTSGVTDEGITFDWDSGSNNGRIFSESAGSSNLLFYTTASGSRGERMRIDSSGNLGLGTSSPEGVLSIYGTAAELPTSGTTSNALIELSSNLGNRLNIGLNTATGNYGSYIQASDNNLAVNYSLNLQPNGGNVGIGHSSPQFGLTLPQVSNDSGKIGWEDSGNTKRASITCSSSSDALQFHTGSSDSERMRIDSSGTVGINNDIVIGNQSASGTSGTGRFVATGGELYIQGALAKTTGSAAPIIFSAYNGVNERMRIDSAGNVAIGTTSPDTKLQIENGSISVGSSTNTNSTNTLIAGYGYILSGTKYGNTSIRSTYSNSNNSASLEFYTASSGTATAERMRIDSSGNVGVNTSSPTSQSGKALHIAGDTGGQARIHLTTSYSGHTANDGAYLVALGAESGSSAGTLAIMNYENSPTTFFTNSTERMRILSSGGLTFNGDTAQANALDDYEEGGWTPTIGKNSGTVSVTYTKQHGVYTKIGNLVLIWWDVQVSAISGGSGVGLIRSLPFTAVVASSGGGYGAPQFRDQNLLSTDSKLYSNSSYHSGTDIYLLHHNSSGTEVSTSFNASGRITGWSVYRTST
ncbi:hypothetical protein, partial [uncultured Oceanicoccus sp.]|uniref:hypothetical protein n=1 Tax=uncultured Oceanicoccus sp. TaxID=1706381 RepID=UPI0030D7DC3F